MQIWSKQNFFGSRNCVFGVRIADNNFFHWLRNFRKILIIKFPCGARRLNHIIYFFICAWRKISRWRPIRAIQRQNLNILFERNIFIKSCYTRIRNFGKIYRLCLANLIRLARVRFRKSFRFVPIFFDKIFSFSKFENHARMIGLSFRKFFSVTNLLVCEHPFLRNRIHRIGKSRALHIFAVRQKRHPHQDSNNHDNNHQLHERERFFSGMSKKIFHKN